MQRKDIHLILAAIIVGARFVEIQKLFYRSNVTQRLRLPIRKDNNDTSTLGKGRGRQGTGPTAPPLLTRHNENNPKDNMTVKLYGI